jgi:flagellar biosynthesis protein FliQ
MDQAMAVDIFRQALMTAFWVSLPLLAIGFLAGIVISLLQVLTSIQDPAFGTVPRLAAFFVGFLLTGGWMLSRLMTYTHTLLGDLSRYAR